MSPALARELVTTCRPGRHHLGRGARGREPAPSVSASHRTTRTATVECSSQSSCNHVPGTLGESTTCPQPRSPSRPGAPGRSCGGERRPERSEPVRFGERLAAAECSGGIPTWHGAGPRSPGGVVGRARPFSPPSPEVDLILASSAGARQHQRGRYVSTPAAYRPLLKKNRSCNHPGTNQSVSSFRV